MCSSLKPKVPLPNTQAEPSALIKHLWENMIKKKSKTSSSLIKFHFRQRCVKTLEDTPDGQALVSSGFEFVQTEHDHSHVLPVMVMGCVVSEPRMKLKRVSGGPASCLYVLPL